jgi:WD40 repeat protein
MTPLSGQHGLAETYLTNRNLTAATLEGRVRLWEVATGKERRRLEGHEGEVTCAAFSQDGGTLLTAANRDGGQLDPGLGCGCVGTVSMWTR